MCVDGQRSHGQRECLLLLDATCCYVLLLARMWCYVRAHRARVANDTAAWLGNCCSTKQPVCFVAVCVCVDGRRVDGQRACVLLVATTCYYLLLRAAACCYVLRGVCAPPARKCVYQTTTARNPCCATQPVYCILARVRVDEQRVD